MILFQQNGKTGIWIIHQDQCRPDFPLGLKVLGDNYGTGLGCVYVLLVLRISEKGNLSRPGLLNFCQHVNLLTSVATDFSLEDVGDLMKGEFHDGRRVSELDYKDKFLGQHR